MGSRFAERLRAFEARHPGVVEQRPYVPHHEALAEMLAADALLLVVGAGDGSRSRSVVAGTLPGKIFEYLRAARPVLLLGDEAGDAATLLRRHGRGWVADETQPAAIAAALQQMMQAAPEPATAPAASVAAFERRALAGELAQLPGRAAARAGGAVKRHLCLLGDANSVHLRRWAHEMQSRGWRVSVVTARPQPMDDVEQRVLPPVQRPTDWLWRAGAARRHVQDLAPDLVHAHYVTSYGYLAARCGRHPLVMTAWGSDLLVTPRRSCAAALR